MGSTHRHEHHHRRFVYLPVIATVVTVIIVAWFFLSRPPSAAFRQTIVLVSSPMTIASWNSGDSTLTMLTIPADVVAEGTHGYGTYSLEAFWKLGEIDKKDGSVLAESLSEALGVPVDWYIGPKAGLFAHADSPLTLAKHVFSFAHLWAHLRGHYRTNIPLRVFMELTWVLHMGRPQQMKTFDFSQIDTAIAQDTLLPDGSHQMVLDPQRLDVRLKSVFEDTRTRGESVTVAVYNTTTMPSLGNRVARLLGHLGVSVVTVGNDTPSVDGCTVSGHPMALKSISAQLIASVLQCTLIEKTETDRADLIVRMGRAYEKRFVPN